VTTLTIKLDETRAAADLAALIDKAINLPYVPDTVEAIAFNRGVTEAINAAKAALPVLVEQANGVIGPYGSIVTE
jgi:hypothetical protein